MLGPSDLFLLSIVLSDCKVKIKCNKILLFWRFNNKKLFYLNQFLKLSKKCCWQEIKKKVDFKVISWHINFCCKFSCIGNTSYSSLIILLTSGDNSLLNFLTSSSKVAFLSLPSFINFLMNCIFLEPIWLLFVRWFLNLLTTSDRNI